MGLLDYRFGSQLSCRLVLLSLCSIFFLTANFDDLAALDERDWGKVTEEEIEFALPPQYSDQAAAVIFDDGELEIPRPSGDFPIQLKRHKRIKIFRPEGAEVAVNITIEVYPGDKIKDVKAQTISADGKRTWEVDDDDIHKQSVEDFETVTFTFPAVEPNCFVEFKYKLRHSRYVFLDPWYFQDKHFTKESRFSCIIHTGFDYSVSMKNVPYELQQPEQKSLYIWGEKCAEFIWTLNDVPPVSPEPYMPAAEDLYASLSFQLAKYEDYYSFVEFASDWSSLGELVTEILDKRVDDRDDIADLAKRVLTECKGATAVDTLKCLWNYIKENYKTESVIQTYFVDITDTDDLLEDRKGSAPGKNLLLVEMLKSVGVDAKPLLILTREFRRFDPQIYQLNQFDYLLCLAVADSVTYILDTQDKRIAFPFIPAQCQAEGGLLVEGENSRPVRLTHPQRISAITTHAQLSVRQDGSAICSTHVNLRGHFLAYIDRLLDGEIEPDDITASLIEDADDLTFELDTTIVQEFCTDDSVVIDLVMTFPDLGQMLDDNLVFEPLIFAPRENPFEKSERNSPVDFGFALSQYVVTDIVLEDGIELASIPAQMRESIDGVLFNRTSFGGGNQARVVSQLIVDKEIFQPHEYPELRSIFETASQAGLERAVAQKAQPEPDGDSESGSR